MLLMRCGLAAMFWGIVLGLAAYAVHSQPLANSNREKACEVESGVISSCRNDLPPNSRVLVQHVYLKPEHGTTLENKPAQAGKISERCVWCLLAAILAITGYSTHKGLKDMDGAGARIVFVICFSTLVQSMDYTAIVPTVYDLAISFNVGGTFSGAVIGLVFASTALGALLHHMLSLGSRPFRHVYIASCAIMPVGPAVYALSALRFSTTASQWMMLSARVISGIPLGILWVVGHAMVAKVTRPSLVIHGYLLYNLAFCVGTGLGPIVSSFSLRYIAPQLPSLDHNVVPAAMLCIAHLAILVLCWCLLPSVEKTFRGEKMVEDIRQLATLAAVSFRKGDMRTPPKAVKDCDVLESETNGSTRHYQRASFRGTVRPVSTQITEKDKEFRVLGVLRIYIMAETLLLFSTGASESATLYALQVDYHWSPMDGGYIIGLCLCGYAPLALMVQWLRRCISDAAILANSLVLAAAMTWLLHPGACAWFERKWPAPGRTCAPLIIAFDALAWPLISLVRGILEGFLYDFAGIARANHLSAALTVVTSLAYAVSSPLARWFITSGGVTRYALVQIVTNGLAVVACGIAVTLSRPGHAAGGQH